MKIFKPKLSLMVAMLALVVPPLAAGTDADTLSPTGTAQGTIVHVEFERGDPYSFRIRVRGRMHEFLIGQAKLSGGVSADLQENAYVRVRFRNREHSEMDDFFTADAVSVTLLKHGSGPIPR